MEDIGSGFEAEIRSRVVEKKPEKIKRAVNFRLTSRDLDLLSYLLDQKFLSLEQIYFKFFDVRKSSADPMPRELFVTRQRIQILRAANLIRSQMVMSNSKALYLITPFGSQVLKAQRPHEVMVPVVREIDFRNYEHDTRVTDCRIAIERTGRVMKWLPERRLRIHGFESQFSNHDLPKEIVPDGIFVTKKGERFAFEIETTPRKKSRYEDKRDSLLSVMRGSEPLVHKVIWVGSTDRIYRDLKSVVDGEKNFTVETYGHFLSKLWPSKAEAGGVHE